MPTLTEEIQMPVACNRFWSAIKEGRELFPKIAPDMFASITDAPGSLPRWEIGSERIVKFGSAAPEGAFVKEKITAIDDETMYMAHEEVEGGHLAMGFSKWAPSVKVIMVDATTCKVVTSVDYEGGNEMSLEQAKEGFLKMAQGMTAYLQSSGAYA